MLTRKDILEADDLVREEAEVPEWGGSVWVRTLTGVERDDFEQGIIDGKKMKLDNIRAKMCVRCIVDESGERVFTDSDVTELGAKSSLALNRLFGIAQRLNGMSEDDVEELAKNSDAGQSEDSTSD